MPDTKDTARPGVYYKALHDNPKCDANAKLGQEIIPTKVEVSQTQGRNYPPCSFINIVKTTAAYLAFFGAGMGNSIFGATILQLQVQTSSTPNQIASIFTWRALGSMCGNILVAALFDKIPPELILSLGTIILASATLAVPFCTSFVALTVVIVINGFSHGTLGGGCNSYVVKTWRLKSPPFIQALHFITSFGSCISPLVVDSFVTEDTDSALDNNSVNMSYNNYTAVGVGTVTPSMEASLPNVTNQTFMVNFESSALSELFFPFLIVAVLIASASTLFVWALVMDMIKFHKTQLTRVDSYFKQQKEQKEPMTHKRTFALIFIFLIIYGGMECTYGAWIVAFSIKYLNTPFETAALICTAYWASLAGGRAVSIVTTKIFTPAFLICVCLMTSMVAIVVMTFTCTQHIAVTWVCSIVIGVTFAPTFGNCIAFSQQEFHISSTVTSWFCLCLYLGFMGMPALVGFLFVNYTPMFFLYILAVGSILITSIFFGIVIHTRCSAR